MTGALAFHGIIFCCTPRPHLYNICGTRLFPNLTLLTRCRLAVAIRDSGILWAHVVHKGRDAKKTGCERDHAQDRHVDVDDVDLGDPSILEDPAVDLAQLDDATVKQTGLKGHSLRQ